MTVRLRFLLSWAIVLATLLDSHAQGSGPTAPTVTLTLGVRFDKSPGC